MKLHSIFVFGGALCAALSFAGTAPARPLAPKLATAQNCAPDKNSNLYKMFNRLPPYVFRYFGTTKRDKLINDDRIIFDKTNGFIEIPYKGRSNHPDRDKFDSFQMRQFRDRSGKPVLVVSSRIFSEAGVKPFVHVFRLDPNGDLIRTTERDWKFKPQSMDIEGRRIYFNTDLPRKGNFITTSLPESDGTGTEYEWTGSKFIIDGDDGDDGHGRPPGF